MKLAVSNIAWDPAEDEAVAQVLRAHDFEGVELAPTKLWPQPLESTAAERADCRKRWADRGLRIVAMQSLLFGHPELKLFEDVGSREAMAQYLKGIIDLAADLGAGALVFGSPSNRKRGTLSTDEAFAIAVAFFREVGRHAREAGVAFCIEPNPPAYGCDFVTTSEEGRLLVDAVGERGFGLHLDAAGMFLADEDPSAAPRRHVEVMRHFHVSAPNLGPVSSTSPIDYGAIAQTLRSSDYRGWVSIEMRALPSAAECLSAVTNAVELCAAAFSLP